ncbi:MAG TPA: amidohydrolase family protein, partial [Lacipirellulaceae bacterium]|nr:amidohydrolase family protein [Lacipirellulaceae bacterium]
MKSLRAKWIVPVTRRPLEGGCVTIAGGRIVEVGPRPPAGAQVTDLGDVALLPGLVNAHTHLEFSDLVGPLGRPGMALPDWIRLVIAERKRSGRDVAAARNQGNAECLAAGVTTIG